MKLSEMVRTIDSPEGHQRVFAYLKTLPYPHFEAIPGTSLWHRTEANGECTIGRFVGRLWIAGLGHEGAEQRL